MEKQDRPMSWYEAMFNGKFYSHAEMDEIRKVWSAYVDSICKPGHSEATTCVPIKHATSGALHHFGIVKKFASMWGYKPDDVLDCRITITDDHVRLSDIYKSDYDSNTLEYFGWVPYDRANFDEDHAITLIQPNIKAFSCQFAGGGDMEANAGGGKVVKLSVELLR